MRTGRRRILGSVTPVNIAPLTRGFGVAATLRQRRPGPPAVVMALLAALVLSPHLGAQAADYPASGRIDPWAVVLPGELRSLETELLLQGKVPRTLSLPAPAASLAPDAAQTPVASLTPRAEPPGAPVSLELASGLGLLWASGRRELVLPSYADRTGVLDLGIQLDFGNVIRMYGDLGIREERFAADDPANLSTIPNDGSWIDYEFPFRSGIIAGGEGWQFGLGRDRVRVGPGLSGQLVLGSHLPFVDHARLSLWNEVLQFQSWVVGLEPWLTAEEVARDGEPEERAKNLLLHRFEYAPTDWLLIGLTEGLMFSGQRLDVARLNPAAILHNFYIWEYAASLSALDLSLALAPGLVLYASAAMNQLQSPFEIRTYGADGIPNALAALGGLQAARPLGDRLALRLDLEYAWLNPWMYIRETQLRSFTWRHRYTSNYLRGRPLETLPLGHRWGPDSRGIVGRLALESRAGRAGFLALAAQVEISEHGEQTVLSPYDEGEDATSLQTPSGNAETRQLAALMVDWEIPLGPFRLVVDAEYRALLTSNPESPASDTNQGLYAALRLVL